jgi:hypothetical protein
MILLLFVIVVSSLGCVEQRKETQIVRYNGTMIGNVTKTIVTHDGENAIYYGRVMEVHIVPDENNLVIFQDNLTVPCWPVGSYDWMPGKMHKMTIGPSAFGHSRYIYEVLIGND